MNSKPERKHAYRMFVIVVLSVLISGAPILAADGSTTAPVMPMNQVEEEHSAAEVLYAPLLGVGYVLRFVIGYGVIMPIRMLTRPLVDAIYEPAD